MSPNIAEGFFLKAVTSAAEGKAINIGTSRKMSVGCPAKLIAKVVGREVFIRTYN